MDEEEDERREAALASSQTLRPNFRTKDVTQDQLSKFQELHRRRLQIKSKSKFDKKSKGGIAYETSKSVSKALKSKHNDDGSNPSTTMEDSSVPNLKTDDEDVAASLASKKRQKLHWGLDTKERWERKANM